MIPLVDLSAQHAALAGELRAAFEAVLESERFILGEAVERFESGIASYVGVRHAVGVSSGSDALLCTLMALEVRPGDEVITTPFSFFATVGAILRLGARPRFVDIDAGTFNMDLAELEAAIGPRTRAIVPVHLFGQTVRLSSLLEIAGRHGVPVVEDAAQALGAAWQGKRAGAWGTLGCFSFFPSKPLGGFGDGGMIVTNDDDLAARCRALRAHGAPRRGEHEWVGGNFRLDALQAALLSVKLPHLDHYLSARAGHAAAYDAELAGLDGVALPAVASGAAPAWAHYTLRVARRDEFRTFLKERDVATAVYYDRPLYAQPALAPLGMRQGACPRAEAAAAEVVSIPLYPELSGIERAEVVAAVRDFATSSRRA